MTTRTLSLNTGWYLLGISDDALADGATAPTVTEALTWWGSADLAISKYIYEQSSEPIAPEVTLSQSNWTAIDITSNPGTTYLSIDKGYWVHITETWWIIIGTLLKYNSSTGILGLIEGSVFTGKITSDDETAELKAELDTAFPNTTFVVVDDSTTDYTFSDWRLNIGHDDPDIDGNTYQLITTNVTDFEIGQGTFHSGTGVIQTAYGDFNEDISSWDTSSATTMRRMFYEAYQFNQDISNWDVSNVAGNGFEWMFFDAVTFNIDLSNWDISSATDMDYMFACTTYSGTSSFDQVLYWDIPEGCSDYAMFLNTNSSLG